LNDVMMATECRGGAMLSALTIICNCCVGLSAVEVHPRVSCFPCSRRECTSCNDEEGKSRKAVMKVAHEESILGGKMAVAKHFS
jgi:hypothetical protein